MTDQSSSAFDIKSEETPQAQVPSDSSALADQLAQIKNEEGAPKYSDVGKALEALAHSQNYIPELKGQLSAKDQEIAALKEQVAKASAIDEVVERLSAQQEPTQETTPQASGLDEQAVLNLMQNFTEQQQAQALSAQNELSVSEALTKKFGDKTTETIQTKAQQLGMTVEGIQELARKSPQAALSLFQVEAPRTGPSVTTGSVHIPPTTPEAEQLAPPDKSLLRGASTKDQVEYLKKIREQVYKRHNVTV